MQAIASDPDIQYYSRRAIELIQESRTEEDNDAYHKKLIMAIRLLTLARAEVDNGSI